MASNALVRARIDEKLKDEATAVLAEMGLTVSDIVRITLTRVAKDKALPFEMKIPNSETRAAISQSRILMKESAPRFDGNVELIEALDNNAGKQ